MESDKFLVEMFLPEGAKRCSYSNAALVSLNMPHYLTLSTLCFCSELISHFSYFTFLFCALKKTRNQRLILFSFISQPIVSIVRVIV